MAMDRYTKLELKIRTAFREFILDKLASGRSKAQLIPAFDIPRSETVDLFVAPKAGATLALVQRFDYVTVYRHTVGQLVGTLGHFRKMNDREIRKALRASIDHPALEEMKQNKIEPLKLSKRLVSDIQAGKITLALVADLPEVPQQAKEFAANYDPIMPLIQTWFSTAIKRKKICQGVQFYTVNLSEDPPKVQPLEKAIKLLIK